MLEATLIVLAIASAIIAWYVLSNRAKTVSAVATPLPAATKKAPVKTAKVDITKKSSSASSADASSSSRKTSDAVEGEHPLVIRHLRGHQGPITGISVGIDGRHIASVSEDESLRVWTVVDGQPNTHFARHNLKKGEHASAVALSADDTYVAIAVAETKSISIFGLTDDKKANTASLKLLHSFPTPHKAVITRLKFSSNSQFLVTQAAGANDLNMYVFSPKGAVLATLAVNQLVNYSVAVSDDSRFITAGSKIADAKIWEVTYPKDSSLREGEMPMTLPQKIELAMSLKGGKRGIADLAFGPPSSGLLVTGSVDGSFSEHLLNVRYQSREDPKTLRRTQTEFGAIDLIDVTTSGKQKEDESLIVLTSGATMQLWKSTLTAVSTPPQLLTSIPAPHKGRITHVEFARRGTKPLLVSAGENKSITLYRLP